MGQQTVTLPVCSLVMKAVQARLPAHVTADAVSTNPEAPADPPAAPFPSPPSPPSPPTAAAATVLTSVRQACAVKLGDGGLSKAQTDPRLPARARQGVLQDIQAMVEAGGQVEQRRHGPALSQVLREAYVDVARKGVLMGH
jgi:hypothetical protein